MIIQIPYQEIKNILTKKLMGGVSIERIEYLNDKTVNVAICKSISLLSANLPLSADLCVVDFYGHNVVIDLHLDGLAGVWQKIASIKWINESHLEWLLREVFDLGGLVSIDDNNRNRLTIHLDKIDALKSTLEVLKFKGLSFNNSGAEFVAEALQHHVVATSTQESEVRIQHHVFFSTSSMVEQTKRMSKASKTTLETKCISFAAMRRSNSMGTVNAPKL